MLNMIIRLGFACILLQFVQSVDRSNFKTCEQSAFCKRNRALQSNAYSFEVVANKIKLTEDRLEAILHSSVTNRSFGLHIWALKDSTFRVTIDEIDGLRPRFKPLIALTGEPQSQKLTEESRDDHSLTLSTADRAKVVLQFSPFRIDAYSGEELVLTLNSQGLLNFEHFRLKPGEKVPQNQDVGDQKSLWQRLTGRLSGWGWSDETPEIHAKVDNLQTEGEDNPDAKAEEKPPAEEENLPEPDEIPGDKDAQQDQIDSADTGDKQEGMWEETFKSHHDSKPFGPSSVGMDISFIGFEHTYGVPEHADSFVLRDTKNGGDPYRLYNLDVFEYELNNPMALYGAVPYILGHNERKTVGVFWLNSAETWVDVHPSTADKGVLSSIVDRFRSSKDTPIVNTHWMSESGVIDVFVMLGPMPTDLFRQYSTLTGVSELPPMFATAYHQCRWNYNDMEDVKQVDQGFDDHDIPYDVIWLDIEHTDGKRYFTWDPNKFPDPKRMIEGVAAKGRKMVTIIDPHIKKDDNYKVYKEAKDLGYFVKDKNDGDYDGWCWPGSSAYLDFMNPDVQTYWAKQFQLENYQGSTESLWVWNDMNEPSVFNGPEVTMYKDSKHFGGWEHRDVHNIYGMLHHAATYRGLKERSNGRLRPFVLTRSFFAGSQRYSSVWTGDNTADWGHLRISIPMMLSLGVTGIPFVGADVGGFFRNPDEELLARWYQVGAFSPFFRAHAHLDTKRREPWLFSEKTKLIIREAIRRRYKLLPYWYTQFRQHSLSGVPILRPLWMEFPADKLIFDEERQFMVGPAILVRPVMDTGVHSISVYLPGANSVWYDWDTFKLHIGPGAIHISTPMEKIPVYQRGGTIVPTKERVRRASSSAQQDPITLRVALDVEGQFANGTLYMDDGETYEYSHGKYIDRRFEYQMQKNNDGLLTSTNLNPEKSKTFATDSWIEKIIVMGVNFVPSKIELTYEGTQERESHHKYAKVVRRGTGHSLTFTMDETMRVLTIRRPGVHIDKDWQMAIIA